MTEKSPDSETGYLDGVKPAGEGETNNPASPGRDEDASPKSMLEAVQAAVETKTEEGESSAPKEGQAGEAEVKPEMKAGEEPADKGETEDRDDQLPFHKHKRWQEVTRELKELRPLKVKAEAFDQLQQAMQQAGVTPAEADEAIELWRLMKTDPAGALKTLKPYVAKLESFTGESLPDDLKQAVDEGRIDEALAKQVAKDRGALNQTKAVQQQTQRATVEQTVGEARKTADSLWNDWKSTDPDFDALSASVQQGFKVRMLEAATQRQMVTPEKAREFFNSSLTEARAALRKLRPAKPEVKPVDPATGGSVPGAAKPSSMLEAIKQAADGRYVLA
jgi:hypothetical protein